MDMDLNRVPVSEEDSCYVCRVFERQCYEDCPHRLPPDDPSLRDDQGRPRSKHDPIAHIIHFEHGQKELSKMGYFPPADITKVPPFKSAQKRAEILGSSAEEEEVTSKIAGSDIQVKGESPQKRPKLEETQSDDAAAENVELPKWNDSFSDDINKAAANVPGGSGFDLVAQSTTLLDVPSSSGLDLLTVDCKHLDDVPAGSGVGGNLELSEEAAAQVGASVEDAASGQDQSTEEKAGGGQPCP